LKALIFIIKEIRMIRQNWVISEEERNRIISLHESATSKNYLIFEQNSQVTGTEGVSMNSKPGTDKVTFEFFFESGYHSEKSADKEQGSIVDQVSKTFEYLKDKLKRSEISEIEITAGESAVTNYDNEIESKPSLPPGELAKKRSETLGRLISTNLKNFFNSNLIARIPKIKIGKLVVGKSREKDSDEARNEQYVKATFTINQCNISNLYMLIEYVKVPKGAERYHCCNHAQFRLLLNGTAIPVMNSGGDIINLNNFNTDLEKTKETENCKSVSRLLYVSPVLANEILGKGDEIKVEVQCVSSGSCHNSPMRTRIWKKDETGKTLSIGGEQYLGFGDEKTRLESGKTLHVANMDRCGNLTVFKNLVNNSKTTDGQNNPVLSTGSTEPNKS
jgi:hypothetical protein